MSIRRKHYVAALISIAFLAASPPRDTIAASCGGQSHSLALSDGTVSPGSGELDDRFSFRVTYADNNGCAPDRIVVVIIGFGEFGLSFQAGDLREGATFVRRLQLPAGTWSYRFEAESGSGIGQRTVVLAAVDPRVVTVRAPTPAPTAKPTPKPMPAPTTVPTPAVTSTPSPTTIPAEPSPASSTQSPEGSPTAGPSSVAGSDQGSGQPFATANVRRTGDRSPEPQLVGGQSDQAPPSRPDLPRPVVALIISSMGTLVGLGLFVVLGRRLIDPRPSRATTAFERITLWTDPPDRSPR
jgi:hypothetical protein